MSSTATGEMREGFLLSASFLFFFFELYCILFLQLHLCLVNDFFKHIFAQFHNYQRIILAY